MELGKCTHQAHIPPLNLITEHCSVNLNRLHTALARLRACRTSCRQAPWPASRAGRALVSHQKLCATRSTAGTQRSLLQPCRKAHAPMCWTWQGSLPARSQHAGPEPVGGRACQSKLMSGGSSPAGLCPGAVATGAPPLGCMDPEGVITAACQRLQFDSLHTT